MKSNSLIKAICCGIVVFILCLVGAFFSNAITIGEFPITQTGLFQFNPNSRYIGSEDRNGTPVNIWEYEIQFTKPANYKINLNMNFIDTAESGHSAVNVVSIKTDRGTSLPVQLSSFSNSDLMSGKRHNIDVNGPAFSHITESNPGKIIYRVETPVSLPRNFYNLNAYVGGKITIPANQYYSPPGGEPTLTTAPTDVDLSRFFNPTNNATYANSNVLNSLNSRYESPFLVSTRRENMFIAGDYIKGNSVASTNQIKWTLSVPNTSGGLYAQKENQTYNVPLDLDSSQTKRSAELILYKPGPNGFVVASKSSFSGGDIVVPPDHLAQVVVVADVNDHEKQHTFNGAALDSLKDKIKINKEWLDGATPVPLTFKLYNQDSWIKDIQLPVGKTQISELQAQFKYVIAGNKWKKVNFDIKEIVPAGYTMVQSSQSTNSLEFNFTNIKTFVPPVAGEGECQQYGVFHVDNLKIYEYFKDPNGKQIHDHGGRLFGKFRIPPRAKAGDYFDFELPKEIKFEKSPNENVVFFYIHKGSGEKIGEVKILDKRTLRFTLYNTAYSETSYEGDFKVGSLIKHAPGYIARIDGRPTTEQFENQGIIPDLAYFGDGRPTVSKNVRFTSTYKKGDLGDCPREVSNPFNVSATFLDREGARHGLIRKEIYEYGKDYVIYDILFNGAGEDRGNGELTFVEMLNTTITPYTGDPRTSIEFYEVTPIRYAYGYDPNSLRPATANISGLMNADYFGYSRNRFPVSLTKRFDIKIRNMGNRTFLARFKVRKTPTENGTFYNWVHYYSGLSKGVRKENEHQTIGRSDGETRGDSVVDFENKFSFRINKKDGTTRQKITSSPATFELLNERNGGQGDVISTSRTDSNGEIVFLGVENGTYYIKEKLAPTGYQKSNDVIRIRVVNATTAYYSINGGRELRYDKIIGLDFNNYPENLYSLKVRKTDGAGKTLEGSVFRLFNADGSYNQTIGENISADVYIFGNLSKGRYTLEEVKAPDGYERISPIQIEVTDSGITKLNDGTHISSSEVTYKSSDRTGEITVKNLKNTDFILKKVKLSTPDQILTGVKFELYKKAEDTNIPGEKLGEYTVNQNGEIKFTNLKNGGYFLKETQAANGYKLNDRYYEISVLDGQASIGSSVLIKNGDSYESVGHDGMLGLGTPQNGITQFLFANRLSSVEFKIKKVRLGDENIKIDGVRFELYDSPDRVREGRKIKEGTTSNGGQLSFTGLEPGTYFLKEVETPAPYIHNEKSYKIIISDDASTVTIENKDNLISFENGQSSTNINNSSVGIVFKNDRIIPKFAFNVKKVDADNNEPISRTKDKSARIQILDSNKRPIRGEGANLTNGVQVFKNGGKKYEPGIYYIKEERAPEGYVGLEKLIKFEITELGEVNLIGFEPEDGTTITSADDVVTVNKGKLVGTEEDSIEIHIKNESVKGKFKLKKTTNINQVPVLSGVKFKLLDSTGNNQIGDDIVTGRDGIAEFNNLKAGSTYYIQEKETNEGYFLNDTKYRVNVSWLGNVTVVIPQGDNLISLDESTQDSLVRVNLMNKRHYDIKVVKIDGASGEPINSTNASPIRFEIQSPLGTRYRGEAANFANGTSEFTFTDQGRRYGPGEYYIVEKNAPSGYLPLEEPIKIVIADNGDITFDDESGNLVTTLENSKAKAEIEGRTIKISAKNEKPTNKFKLKKVVNPNNATLDSVVFDLYKKAPNADQPGEKIGDYTTASGGIIEFNNLELGTYYLKEISVPNLANPNSAYGLNENYYKINVTRDSVKIGNIMLVKTGENTYTSKPVDKKFVEGKTVDSVKELIFKNDIVYKVSFEKNVLTGNRQPRVYGMKFLIRNKDVNNKTPITYIEKKLNGTRAWEPVTVQNGVVDGKQIPAGAFVWEYTNQNANSALSQQASYWNPVFELAPGTYVIEEIGVLEGGYERLDPFEITVANDGQVSINGFTSTARYPNGAIAGTNENGDVFIIFNNPTQTGRYSTNSAVQIHIFNKKPMRFYLDKLNPSNERIINGSLTIKLEGAMIFGDDAQKTDEKTFNLETDYVDGKGLRIDIPKELPSGVYILTEVEAPETYIKTNKRYHIEINRAIKRVGNNKYEARTIKLIKIDEGENVNVVNVPEGEQNLFSDVWENNTAVERILNVAKIENRKQVYPSTGGYGDIAFTALGSAMMLGSLYMIHKRKEFN